MKRGKKRSTKRSEGNVEEGDFDLIDWRNEWIWMGWMVVSCFVWCWKRETECGGGGRKKRFLRVEAKVAFWFAPFNQNGCQSNQTQRILPAHPFHCRFQVSTFFCLPFHFPRIHSSTHYSLSLSIISNKIQLIILFLSSILFQYNFPFLFFSLETKKFQLFFYIYLMLEKYIRSLFITIWILNYGF